MRTTTDRTGAGRSGDSMERPRFVAPTAGEWAMALLIVAIALVARAWAFSTLGVNHFDEGVYVFSALGLSDSSQPFTLFPNQQRFSPPFYFTAISLLHRLTGLPIDVAAIALNTALGTATVVLVWWFGRHWFGPRAGLAAAALLALSQAHITMSRVALTDAAFSFFFLLTVGLIVVAVERESLKWAILAGLAGGLIWNTKYHGWFTLLVTGAALVPSLWFARKRITTLRRPLVAWGIAAVVAAAMYAPWALYIRASDGYRDIANYYLTLINGEWFANLSRHVQQQMFLDGAVGRTAVLVALAVVLTGITRPAWPRLLIALAAAAGASLLLGFFGTVTVLALLAVPSLVRDFALYRNRVLLAWLGLWVVAAPLYHPYARLLLPFTVVTCVLAGAWLARFADRWIATQTEAARAPGRAPAGNAFAPALALVFALVTGAIAMRRPAGGDPWRPARDLADAAGAIAESVPAGNDVYVLGEPPLAFYVHTSGRSAFRRVGMTDLDTISRTAWLVTGVYTDRAPNLARGVVERADRLTRIRTMPFRPNDLRLLDDFNPTRARNYRAQPDTTFDLTLYRIEPVRGGR